MGKEGGCERRRGEGGRRGETRCSDGQGTPVHQTAEEGEGENLKNVLTVSLPQEVREHAVYIGR